MLDSTSADAESSFEVYFILPGDKSERIYNYGFCINKEGVTEEWLNSKAKTARKYSAVFYRGTTEEELEETKTRTMIDKCLELTAYDAQYRIPWIVFDRDQVQGFDQIIAEAVSKGIQAGWSEFGRIYEMNTGQKYSKAD